MVYITSEDGDEKVFNIIKKKIVNHSRKVSIMYLNVSTYCNLACKYCFIDNNPLSENDRRIMKFETAKNAIDKFKIEIIKNKEEKESQIILYGGEPLSNKKYIEQILDYAREQLPITKIILITNGTMLDEQTILYLNKRDVIIGLSLDGPKCVNDKYRVFKDEEGSVYDNVKNKIVLLNKHNSKYGLSSTVTKDLIDCKDEMLNVFNELKVHDVFFNLLHYSSFKEEKEWVDFYNSMSDFILDSNKKLEEIHIREGRIRDQLNLLSGEILKFQSCGAVGLNQITVQPDGSVCICQGDSRSSKNVIGNINNDSIEDMLKNKSVKKWTNYYTMCRKECKYCEALFVCGGGCPLQSEALFGSRDALDKASCLFYKKFLTCYLKKYYNIVKEGECYDNNSKS